MPTPKVHKRNGSIEEYIPEKMIVSMIKNGIPITVARKIEAEIRNDIRDMDSISSLELAYRALVKVKEYDVTNYLSWIYYDINHKRRRTDYDIKRVLGKEL